MTDEKNEVIEQVETEKATVNPDDCNYVREEGGECDEKGLQIDGTEAIPDETREPVDKDSDEHVAQGFVPLVPSRRPVNKDERIRELERKHRDAKMYVLFAALILLCIGLSFLPSILLVMSPQVLMPIFLACMSGGAALLVGWYIVVACGD